MNFHTPVLLPTLDDELRLSPQSYVMFLGSCFADHVGTFMQDCLPQRQVCINPHGTLYNPMSICKVVNSLLQGNATEGIDSNGYFKVSEDEWRHWDYSTLFSASTKEELKKTLWENWSIAKSVFCCLDVLFITFSTDHVYCLRSEEKGGSIVANCHKQPNHLFDEKIADWHTMLQEWTRVLELLQHNNPQTRVVFTLSPYRYAKYGMHENALSKSRLLLLIDALEKQNNQVSYFPAYEIINDELRDYRFYAEDMLHPSTQAVSYVWEQFSQWIFSNDMHIFAKERMAIKRDMNHRPLHPESETYTRFLLQLEKKKQAFEKKWNMNF